MTSSIPDHSVVRSPSLASPRMPRSRTQSISSDRPSTIGLGLVSPPSAVTPEAAFIASSAASQIVTNDHDSHADSWYDDTGMLPPGETALVTPSALQLVNNFLDQLLFSFLQASKATTLSALRPAVTEVLKPKLAKDAINNADEELREYLGGGDEDDFVHPCGADPCRDWDLELVWKRTRLRCMVYSSLGDMEEEEEDEYMEQEHLEIGADEQISDVITPAVAIFLTSVLEYMGELTLTVAGQAAFLRMRNTYEKELKDGTRSPTDIADRIVVGEADMERVALDRTLGRLWRGWKKRIRAPPSVEFSSRPYSRASIGHLRHGSNVTDVHTPRLDAGEEEMVSRQDLEETLAEANGAEAKGSAAASSEPLDPVQIPLPMGENDVDEIEVPGLAYNSDDEEEEEEVEEVPSRRPKSFLFSPTLLSPSAASGPLRHRRSSSVPVVRSRHFVTPEPQAQLVAETTDPSGNDKEKEILKEEAIAQQPGEEPTSRAEKADATQNAQIKVRPAFATIDTNAHAVEAIGVARTTDEKIREAEPDIDTDTYEKAEIRTSARVSVASTSPTASDGDAKRTGRRSSARIVDVAGPRAPGSGSPLMDPMEAAHRRSLSLSRASESSSPTVSEDPLKSRVAENGARASAVTSPLRTSVDRARPSFHNTSTLTISESEEESDHHQQPAKRGNAFEAPSTGTITETSPRAKSSSSSTVKALKSSPSRQQPTAAPNAKVTILNTSSSAGPFIDESIPEVPVRAPGRHSSKPDAGSGRHSGQHSRRRRDSEDTTLYPVHSNASQRQTHTSGSSSSSTRLKPMRTSEEQTPTRAESFARNFEELIHSNQTITYTLTPENMRDMDSPRSTTSPVLPRISQSKGEEARPGDWSQSSSTTATDARGTSSSRIVGVSSRSPSENIGHKPSPVTVPSPSKHTSMSSSRKSAGPRASVPISPAGPKSPKLPASLARDARVPTDSTADFAAFIKSTGPAGDTQPPPVRNPGPGSAKTSLDSRRVSQTSNRNRYQPRDAAVESRGDNSDLIDFIRQGPPGASVQRIPRHVAPFRNTMDSEQMTAAAGGRAVDATIPEVRNSETSTNMTETSSMPSTINSSSALLKHKQKPAQQHGNMFDEDDMIPKRKQRRVRDPYAIDFSDEEDDDDELLMTPPPPPKKKEESLAEFLRNCEPPPEPMETPISQKMPKKKASAPSLMGRLARAGFGREPKEAANGANGKPTLAPESRSLSSRVGTSNSGSARTAHVPIQVNMPSGYDKYGPIEGRSGGAVPRNMMAPGGATGSGRVPMKKFEPRDATHPVSRSSTADLAAFLRDSEPPPSSVAPLGRAGTAAEESGSSFSKAFARRFARSP